MKLLLDQNLSKRLVGRLSDAFPDTTHVSLVGLDVAADREVWDWAGERGYIIVSKDSDFRQLAFVYGPPPKVVWARVGNGPTAVIEALLRASAEAIGAFASDEESALLVLSPEPRTS